MEQTLSHLVQEVVRHQIADELGLISKSTEPVRGMPAPKQVIFDDPTEIAEGLGDDFNYDDQEPETDPVALVPKAGGVKEEDLEKDMKIEDPEHEAKVEAPQFKSIEERAEADQNAEETFSQMLMGEDPDYIDSRVQRRKYRNKNAKRAKVSAYTESNAVEATL